MHIAYAYEFSADDVEVRSGHPYFMLRELEKRASVGRIFPLDRRSRYVFAPKFLYYRMKGQTYMPDREPWLLRRFADQVKRGLNGTKVDCLFAPGSCVTSYLDVDVPKVFCADATFANVLDAYNEFSNCSDEFLRLGHAQEARALATCAAAIYPSEWAARSAVRDYGTDPAKVHVLPFGANVKVPSANVVAKAIGQRSFDPLRVLFIGKEFRRKGADIVLEACEIARRNGMPLRLDLVGLEDVPVPLPDFAVSHGNLTKRDPVKRQKFEDLLKQAHVLFVPSRAENYGIVFCEAAGYGVPSLATDVGGIPSVVRPGVSGVILPIESTAEDFAQALQDLVSDRDRYSALAHSSRAFYDESLSWDVFGDRLMSIIRSVAN